MQQHHIRVFGADPVQCRPDGIGIVAVLAAGERDLGASRQHDLGFGTAARGDEVAAVDHGCSQRAAVDEAAMARMPGRTGMCAIEIAGGIAHQFMGIAPLDQGKTLHQQSFQFNRGDLGAVLLALRSSLRLLIIVKLPLNPLSGTVKQVDRRP